MSDTTALAFEIWLIWAITLAGYMALTNREHFAWMALLWPFFAISGGMIALVAYMTVVYQAFTEEHKP